LQGQITLNLTVFAISDFYGHSLVTTIGIVSSITSGVLQLPIAKVIDLWGRAEGFMIMLLVGVVGLILMAACSDVYTYAAAQACWLLHLVVILKISS